MKGTTLLGFDSIVKLSTANPKPSSTYDGTKICHKKSYKSFDIKQVFLKLRIYSTLLKIINMNFYLFFTNFKGKRGAGNSTKKIYLKHNANLIAYTKTVSRLYFVYYS